MHVLIAGAGVGGLSAALCLRAVGASVHIVEQATRLTEIGAGLQLSPNAMKVFAALGLDDALTQRGFHPQALEMRFGRSGRAIFSTPITSTTQARWGGPYLHIHRADLIEILAETVNRDPGITLDLGRTAVSYAQTARSVTLTLAEGGQLHADLLVGADGLHSLIRQQMIGPEQPRFTGNMAWRATVPTKLLGDLAPPPTACIWVGPRRHAVTYRLRNGHLCNFVGVVERSDWTQESWQSVGTMAEALEDFAGWHPIIGNILSHTVSPYRWALFDRAPTPKWVDGRVCLLGDACHPTLPFMAQGAAMAIEDGFELATALTTMPDGSLSDSLNAYFTRRFPRTSKIQAISRRNMKLFHKRHRTAQLLTYGPMWLAGKVAPRLIQAQQDPIYCYDAVEARG